MTKPQFYTRYNPKPITDGTSFKGHEEVCNQLAAEECEINKLLHQFEAGDIDDLPVVRDAQYNDVLITPQSFADAKAMIDKVTNDFYSLPVDTQRAFGDVQNYVNDLSKIATGDSVTLNKYKNFVVNSPFSEKTDVNNISSSGNSSSSISRSDNEIGSADVKPSDDKVSLQGKE